MSTERPAKTISEALTRASARAATPDARVALACQLLGVDPDLAPKDGPMKSRIAAAMDNARVGAQVAHAGAQVVDLAAALRAGLERQGGARPIGQRVDPPQLEQQPAKLADLPAERSWLMGPGAPTYDELRAGATPENLAHMRAFVQSEVSRKLADLPATPEPAPVDVQAIAGHAQRYVLTGPPVDVLVDVQPRPRKRRKLEQPPAKVYSSPASAAAAALGALRSEKKAAASRLNGQNGGRPLKAPKP